MNAVVAAVAGAAGVLAGAPVAAVIYALPSSGPLEVPPRAWIGGSAPWRAILTTAVLTGTTAALVCGELTLSPALPAFWMFAILGVGLAGSDLRRHRLPYALTGTLYLACTIGFVAEAFRSGNIGPLARASVTAAVVTTGLLVLALALPGQLGLGDVLLAGAISFSLGWLSWRTMTAGVGLGFLVHALVAGSMALRGRSRASQLLPLGPSLLIGWAVAVVTVRS
jgi:leader peptidase (prepilin peptidase)/N-methyltransferase